MVEQGESSGTKSGDCCSSGIKMRPRMKAAGYALLAIASRVGFFIVTPLWLDYFNPINSTLINNVTHSAEMTYLRSSESSKVEAYGNGNSSSSPTSSHSANPYFAVLGQWLFSCVVFGLGLSLILLFRPRRIRSHVERSYPMRNFVMIGCSQGLSSIFMAYAISGSRTPPYLQAILANCALPLQFVIRFLVLRKRPTLLKAICAGVVILSEFICLLPTIFPSLENDQEHRQEGGSTGVDRFLWPIFFVSSMVPFAVANSIMERSVQSHRNPINPSEEEEEEEEEEERLTAASQDIHQSPDTSVNAPDGTETRPSSQSQSLQLDLLFFSFWWTFFVAITLLSFFWVDILPVVGTSSSLNDFVGKMWFNLECLFGGATCSGATPLLGWIDFSTVLFANFAFAGLMRYSEGANFVMVIMTIRTPLVFLFWTLFTEQPFAWQPHAGLSTWLSIGAIVVMVTAIAIYDRAPSEVVVRPSSGHQDVTEDRRPLVAASASATDDLSHAINVTHDLSHAINVTHDLSHAINVTHTVEAPR